MLNLFSVSDVHRLALHIFIVSVITRILDPPHVRVTTPYSGKCFECDICYPLHGVCQQWVGLLTQLSWHCFRHWVDFPAVLTERRRRETSTTDVFTLVCSLYRSESGLGLPRVPGYPTGTRVINYPGNFLLPAATRVPEQKQITSNMLNISAIFSRIYGMQISILHYIEIFNVA